MRHLVKALALLLVPVILVTTPNVANAISSTPATTSFSTDSDFGSKTSCAVVGYLYAAGGSGSASLKGNMECSTEFNVDSSEVSWYAQVPGECSYVFTPVQVDGDPDHSFSIGSGAFDPETCIISELCYSITYGTHATPNDHTDEGCVPWGIGGLETEDVEECVIGGGTGLAMKPSRNPDTVPGSPVGLRYQNWTWAADGGTPSSWMRYVVVSRSGGSGVWYPILSSGAIANFPGDASKTANNLDGGGSSVTSWPSNTDIPYQSRSDDAGNPQETFTVIGMGMIYGPTVATAWSTSWPSSVVREAGVRLPQNAPPPGLVGVTDPSLCAFYWGTKVAEVPGDTDIPIGDLDGGGDEEPELPPIDPPGGAGCTFEFSDPSTWASAGICAVVGLLSALLDLIRDVLGVLGDVLGFLLGLLGELLQMFLDLFVPSDGFFEAQAEALNGAWDDTPPLIFIDSVGTVGDALSVGAPGGGCSGPTLAFTEPVGGNAVSVNPLSSCSEGMSLLASIVRTALQVGVYVGAMLLCARIIAAGFGVVLPAFGRGDGE